MTGDRTAYDVVVVGGGIAGLSAAISATEAGARVALLDRATEQESGGNTRYTEAYMRMISRYGRFVIGSPGNCLYPVARFLMMREGSS